MGLVDLLCGGVLVRFRGRREEWLPPQSHTTQSPTPSESARTSTPLPRQLTPWLGMGSERWVTGSPEGGASAFPQADARRQLMLLPRKVASVVWERDSAQGS